MKCVDYHIFTQFRHRVSIIIYFLNEDENYRNRLHQAHFENFRRHQAQILKHMSKLAIKRNSQM